MTDASASLPVRRAVICAALAGVLVGAVLWFVADMESPGSRLSLSLLGSLGGLLFGGLLALVMWDEEH